MLRIAAGRVYDPANGVAGEVRDVCVKDGKIVADVPGHARRIDARGMVVMPGGVDIHAHIAGPGGQRRAQALARGAPRRRPRPHRDRALGVRRDRPLDVRHGLPLRAARLHDRRRGRHAAARGAPHALRAARHAGHRRRLPPADGQQPAALRAHPLRARPRARRDRLVAPGHGRLRRQARQSRRRRDVEARQRQRDVARRRGPRGHAAERDRDDRHRGARARAAPPGARPLQQPRRVRQLAHDARHAAHARGPPRPSRPPAVPRLRRAAGRAAAVTGAGARRAPRTRTRSSAPTSGR